MARPEFDHVLACRDYNVLGDTCPFCSEGMCHFFGDLSPEPLPEDLVCPHDNLPVGWLTAMVKDWDGDQLTSAQEVRKTSKWGTWLASYEYYHMDPEKRAEREWEILYTLVHRKMSKRQFKKTFKPNNIGVTEKEGPSFRVRVLEAVKGNPHKPPKNHGPGEELISLTPLDRRGSFKVLTRGTFFKEVLLEDLDSLLDTNLLEITRPYVGKKILIKWRFWFSDGCYPDYESDFDFGSFELVKVLE